MIERRIVLFVLTSWLALPVLSLACAMSCLPPAQATVVHCHESSMNDAMAADTGAAIRPGHRCADHAPFTVTATTVYRYATPVPAMPVIVTASGTAGVGRGQTSLFAPASAGPPPPRPIIPLRV